MTALRRKTARKGVIHLMVLCSGWTQKREHECLYEHRSNPTEQGHRGLRRRGRDTQEKMSKKARRWKEDGESEAQGEAPRAQQTEHHSTEEMAGKQGHAANSP